MIRSEDRAGESPLDLLSSVIIGALRRVCCAGIAVILCLLSAAPGAQAQVAVRTTAGQWKGGPVADERGRFSHCAVEGPSFGSGTTLSIRMTRNYHLALGLRDQRWRLRLGPSFRASYQVDQDARVEGRSVAVSRNTVTISMRGSPSYAEALLRRGRVLRVTVDGEELAFALDDSARAMNLLNDCVAAARALNR